MKIIDLEQGSPEWVLYRRSRKMASESAALLRVSPWTTPRNPYELWEIKSGRREVPVTPAMARGSALEATARALYETERRDLMVPYVCEGEDEYAASLDGLSWDGARILEIKCPWKGSATNRLTIIEVRHDPAMQARIRAAWDGFWPDYLAGRAPGEDYMGRLEASLQPA